MSAPANETTCGAPKNIDMMTPPRSVFVTGGTGLIGRRLVRRLLTDGRAVTVLSRKPLAPDSFGPGDFRAATGDPTEPGPWQELASDCDAIVNLAGEPIMARRWSAQFLAKVRESRVKGTSILAGTLAAAPLRADGSPKVFLSGSAVGYYGADSGDKMLTEDAPPGTDPMADIARAWEEAAALASAAGVRVCHPRTGIVLDPDGGAFPRMMTPFKFFVGGRIGSGRQFMSWIHRDDMTELLRFALDTPDFQGPFNAVAPTPVTNAEFSKTLGRVMRRPCWLPVPRFALRIVLGKVVQVVAGGQRASAAKAATAGFTFRYDTLEPALRELLGRPAA